MVVVTEEDGPFSPSSFDRAVMVERFMVGVYASDDAWQGGLDPVMPFHYPESLGALRDVLRGLR